MTLTLSFSWARTAFSLLQLPSTHEHPLHAGNAIIPIKQVKKLKPIEVRGWVHSSTAGQLSGGEWGAFQPTAIHPLKPHGDFLLPSPLKGPYVLFLIPG